MTVISVSDFLLCVAVALAIGGGIALTASRRGSLSHSLSGLVFGEQGCAQLLCHGAQK